MIESFDYNYFLSMASWNHFFRVHDQGLVILDHPDFQPNGKTEYIYDPAIIGTSTSSYTENEVILNTIQQLHVNGEKNNFNNVIVVGDQQTFDRMNALIRARPGQYPWAISMNGDFHFIAHTLVCFHNLYLHAPHCLGCYKTGIWLRKGHQRTGRQHSKFQAL